MSAIGVDSVAELYAAIPDRLRTSGPLDLPAGLASEQEVERLVGDLLSRNRTTQEYTSFLGHGCYPHYVPAICSEINGRAEFLTAYAGEPYEDHGKWQAIFEYTSLMSDLLEMDVVTVPTYDGLQAAATALRMAVRMTGRKTVLVSEAIPEALRIKLDSYLDGHAAIATIPVDITTGTLDTAAARDLLGPAVAGVLLQTPNVFGVVEADVEAIAAAAHAHGALLVASCDPISLGFLPAPASLGADIVCGDIQSLGLGMHFGGAHGGYLAVHDEERFVFELPSRLFGLAPTRKRGELGFTDVAYERTSLARRESGVEWVGTAAALWCITSAVYLSAMGPAGLGELGSTVAAHTRYAIERLGAVPGVSVPFAQSPHWRELVIQFDRHDVAEVNKSLLAHGIFGGVDISRQFPDLGNALLICVTEVHGVDDIERLAVALEGICR